ncbi:MAG: prepilin peptidase [Cyanobacteriota bacterium]|nr:prepilin peptidase [Cyanobacteriota bacterium]
MPDPATLSPAAALLGACFGSFLNVVAWRLPRQESLLTPGSHCTHCGASLRWFENVPLFSWVLLAGHCRHCQRPISVRYWLVEWLCAGLWVAAVWARPTAMGAAANPWLLLLAGCLLLSWLVPLVLIDLDHLWLPEPLCRLGLLLGLLCTGVIGLAQDPGVGRLLLLHHLLAAGVGLLGFEAVSGAAERLLGKPALGLGDAKLAALLGAWLGLAGLGLAVVLAVVSGAAAGLGARLSGRLGADQPFPFGPCLALGGAAVWLLGNGFWLALLPV